MSKQLSTRLSNKLVNQLLIGNQYVLQDISNLLEMDVVAAMRKGVLSRTGENAIVLLINLQKESYATPYVDHIDNDVLYWEGQLRQRFVENHMNSGEYEIFIFVREKVKTPFTYYGRAVPIGSQYADPGTPCKTRFSLYEYSSSNLFREISETKEQEPNYSTNDEGKPTTQLRLVNQRTVQHIYRTQALQLWHNSCAVLDINQPKILIASHIKPWRVAEDMERKDPKNSLILSPLYDKLFDLGMISFESSNGNIKLSNQLSANEYDKLGIDDTKHLVMVPDGTERYLNYHNKYIFDFKPMIETEIDLLTY